MRILYDAFNSDDVDAAIGGTYFEWLANVLKSELPSTPSQKLYAVFPSIDRIFRPSGYKRQGGITTWYHTKNDFAVFQKYLDHFFGERAVDIVFAVIDNSDPLQGRSNVIKLGQETTGRRGGRPQNPPDPKEEALRLKKEYDWNAGQINRYLLNQYGIEKSVRAVQLWLKDAGLESRVGRPRKDESMRKDDDGKIELTLTKFPMSCGLSDNEFDLV